MSFPPEDFVEREKYKLDLNNKFLKPQSTSFPPFVL